MTIFAGEKPVELFMYTNTDKPFMERFFNTAGPQILDIYYSIDPLSRFNLDEMLVLIRQQRPFVLHAPRQTRQRILRITRMLACAA